MPEATWQEALAAEMVDLGRLADVAMEVLDREVPVLREDGDLHDLARASAMANLQMLADIVSGNLVLVDADPPSQAVAFARELARRNVPMSELARTYRVVQRAMWRGGVDESRRPPEGDPAGAPPRAPPTDAPVPTRAGLLSPAPQRYPLERHPR